MLNHDTHSRVGYSTSSSPRHGLARRITSVLNSPITGSASALSYASPRPPSSCVVAAHSYPPPLGEGFEPPPADDDVVVYRDVEQPPSGDQLLRGRPVVR